MLMSFALLMSTVKLIESPFMSIFTALDAAVDEVVEVVELADLLGSIVVDVVCVNVLTGFAVLVFSVVVFKLNDAGGGLLTVCPVVVSLLEDKFWERMLLKLSFEAFVDWDVSLFFKGLIVLVVLFILFTLIKNSLCLFCL